MKHLLFLSCSVLFLLSCGDNKKDTADKDGTKDPRDMMEQQMEQNKTNKPAENPYKNAKLEAKIFNNDSLKQDPNLHGYGYDIYMYDALYVHQPHVPAINGNRGFHTREQAQKTAELVVYKIRNNIMPPSLTVNELDSLGALK